MALAWLGGCSPLQVVDESPTSVSLRYGGTTSLDDAVAEANKRCAVYGKTAKLRETEKKGLMENYAHFYCVGG